MYATLMNDTTVIGNAVFDLPLDVKEAEQKNQCVCPISVPLMHNGIEVGTLAGQATPATLLSHNSLVHALFFSSP